MITTAVSISAKAEFLQGIHQPGDIYKLALYTEKANLDAGTKEYSTSGEVKTDGYTAGGQAFEAHAVKLDGATAILAFPPVEWTGSITARGAAIYNSSKGNKMLAVFDFGKNVTSTDDVFKVKMPPATAELGLIRFT